VGVVGTTASVAIVGWLVGWLAGWLCIGCHHRMSSARALRAGVLGAVVLAFGLAFGCRSQTYNYVHTTNQPTKLTWCFIFCFIFYVLGGCGVGVWSAHAVATTPASPRSSAGCPAKHLDDLIALHLCTTNQPTNQPTVFFWPASPAQQRRLSGSAP
jgi:hypothetical protein